MPADAGFFFGLPFGRSGGGDEGVLRTVECHRFGHAPGRVEFLEDFLTMAAMPSSGCMNDQALVSIRISELMRSGRAGRHERHPAAHGVSEQVDRCHGRPAQDGDQVVGQQRMSSSRGACTGATGRDPLGQGDHPPPGLGRQLVDLEDEVERASRCSRGTGRGLAGPPLPHIRARRVQWACGMQRSSYSAMTISPASGPQAGQPGSRRTLKVRNDCSNAS